MRALTSTTLSFALSMVVASAACSTTISGQEAEEALGADASPQVARADAAPQQAEPDAAPQAAPCVEGDAQSVAADETCYLYFLAELDATGAQAACLSLGATLAIVKDADQQLLVGALAGNALATSPDVWLGANDTVLEASFVWVDGTPMVFDNWRLGEPNNNGGNGVSENCVIIEGDNPAREWDDRICAGLHSYICQRAPQ